MTKSEVIEAIRDIYGRVDEVATSVEGIAEGLKRIQGKLDILPDNADDIEDDEKEK